MACILRRDQLQHSVSDLGGQRGLKLSDGERQRVAIARALLRLPTIWVLDEAMSMLDSRTEAEILRDLRTAIPSCTTITITHRLSSERNADEIAVLDKGEIAERGTHGALLAKGGLYASLWESSRKLV